MPADEGAFLFRDTSTLAGSESDSGSTGHGLYGVLAVEPAGSQWFDPETGQRLDGARPYQNVSDKSGELYLDAIIVPPLAQGNSYSIDTQNLPVRGPDSVAFRETMQISQDEMPGQHLQNCDLAAADNGLMIDGRPNRSTCISSRPLGNNLPTKNSLQASIGLGFNYGEENLLLRQHPINRCADCVGEETWLSSWPYGDPALVKLASGFGPWYPTWHPWYDGGADGINANTGQQNLDNPDDPEDCGLVNGCYTANVPHAYQYDAQKIRFIHAGPKETHVFHMHAHQWLTDSKDVGASGSTPGVPDDDKLPQSATIDSQSFGPGESFTADLLFGAGSRPGTVGDSIFHCHLYPHFAEGFWSLFRTHDVYEDGLGVTPDKVRVRRVVPLPDRAQTPDDPTVADPGYPRFMPGEYGWRAPQPLNGISEPNGLVDDPTTVTREDLSPATRLVAGVGLEQPTQQLSISDAVGGDFTLSFGAETTGNIQWDAAPAALEAALEALNGIKNATVTQPGGPGSDFQIQFVELEVDSAVSPQVATILLTADGTGLSELTPDVVVSPADWVDYPDGLLLDQEIDLGGANDGTFTLSLDGETTADIPWNAATSTVEAALESLGAVLDATVSSGATAGVDYVVSIDQVVPTFTAASVMLDIDGSLLTAPAATAVGPLPGQDIDLGGATGGTYTLTVDGETTGGLTFDAPIATVKAALEALPTVSAATVINGTSPGVDYVVTIDPAGAAHSQLSIDGSLLTAPASASVTNSWGAAHGGQLLYQEVDLTDAAGGTFTLSLDRDTTANIAWNATAAAVEAAVETLDGVTDATVTLGATAAPEYVITINEFVTPLAAGDSGLTADPAELTPPVPSATVSATWSGAGEPTATDVAYRMSLETAATHESHNDGIFDDASGNNEPKPGAPLVDPCPVGSREITYNVSMIQLNIQYNASGWHDTQGRVLVLDSDVDDVLAGRKPIEPFFFRANPNDCVNFNLTNRAPNWVGNDDFLRLIQTNMVGQHIHLVKFDVTASDGASNGWNYQQAAFSRAQRLFDDSILTGDYIVPEPDLAHMPENASGQYLPATCVTDTFDGADLLADGCRIPSPTSFNPQWTCTLAGGCPQGQTISERWYVDYELKTIFTHDHHFPAEDQNRGLFGAMVVEPAEMDVRNPSSGEYLQPINDPSHGTVCGAECNANSVGTRLDVIGPGADDDFREFALAIQDFVSLYRPCTGPNGTCTPPPAHVCEPNLICAPAPTNYAISGEEPVAPPGAPEEFPLDDPGVMGINYRTEPFAIRDIASGAAADPAYVFSSTVHGDPATPLLQAYAGDNMRARVIQGSQEEQHVLQVHGMRWLDEPDDPESGLVNAKSIGISEAFNFGIENVNCGNGTDCFGDYLYGGTATDDMWTGAWGLLRIFGRQVNDLLPLPDNVLPPTYPTGTAPDLRQTDRPPLPATDPGNPCQTGSPVRSFHVIALDTPIVYDDESGQFDPYGLVYAALLPGETAAEGAARVRASNPEPMVLRATEGDCIEVTLTNMIDPEGAFATEHAPVGSAEVAHGFDPALAVESPDGTPAGLRVSLHAALVDYDPLGSDGATIGYNPDQTVGPRQLTDPVGAEGESILYRWFAPVVDPGELGSINLTDYGDVRGHRHHGLFAGLVIEPADATWSDPITGDADTFSPQADIHVPGNNDFREFVTFYQDGLNLWDADGHLPDPSDHGGEADAEDRGEKGLNYRTEAFQQRLGLIPGAPIDHAPGTPSVHAAGGTVINIEGSDLAHVFSSWPYGDRAVGDPDTPVFRAYAGDDVRWRVLQGADKPRQHTFSIAGHSWFRQPNEQPENVETVGAQGALSVGRALNIETTAGGTTASPGDYRYGDILLSNSLSGGWWGLLRVYDPPASEAGITPLDDPDNPHTRGYSPLKLLNTAVDNGSTGSNTGGVTQTSSGGTSSGNTNQGGGQQPQPPVEVLPAVQFAADPNLPFDVVPGPSNAVSEPVDPGLGVLPSVAVAPPAVAFVGAPTFTG